MPLIALHADHLGTADPLHTMGSLPASQTWCLAPSSSATPPGTFAQLCHPLPGMISLLPSHRPGSSSSGLPGWLPILSSCCCCCCLPLYCLFIIWSEEEAGLDWTGGSSTSSEQPAPPSLQWAGLGRGSCWKKDQGRWHVGPLRGGGRALQAAGRGG